VGVGPGLAHSPPADILGRLALGVSVAFAIVMGVGLLGLGIWAFVSFLMVLHKLSRHAATEADVASAF